MPGNRGRPENKDGKRKFGNLVLEKRACARSVQELNALKKSYKEKG